MMGSESRTRVAIVGAGYIAQWHLKAIKAIPGATVIAIVDRDLRRAQSLAAAFHVPHCYESVDQLCDKHTVDVVHGLVPPEIHATVAAECLSHKIDLFMEKPLGISATECATIEELAATHQRHVGVNHNYLYYPAYERLRNDIDQGLLGKIEQISIVWNRPLGQLTGGPFHLWMFREPANIIVETGPHSLAHAIDLAGMPRDILVRPRDPVTLPTGGIFFRRWTIQCDYDSLDVDLRFSYRPGYIEHYVHVRGSHGSAHADLENNLYTLHRSGSLSIDFDRFQRVRQESKELRRQATSNLGTYLWGRVGLGKTTNAFGESIRRSIAAFYEGRLSTLDRRLSIGMGTDVLVLCDQIRQQTTAFTCHAMQQSDSSPPAALTASDGTPDALATRSPSILVLGGTGFIGRELVAQLVRAGHSVRVLSRDPSSVAAELRHAQVDLVRGNALNLDDVRRAMAGVTHVYHLVTGHGMTWDDYYRSDVVATEAMARLCKESGITRLIHAGTIASLYSGRKAGVINGESRPDPYLAERNHYARAKGMAENTLMDMHRTMQLPVVVLRPGIVVGEHGSPYHWGVCMWPNETACRYWGDGNNPLPFVLVDDVAQAFVAALNAPNIEGRALNLVGDVQLSAREYVSELQACSGIRFDAQAQSIWKYYASDVSKWLVKMAIRHPERKRPSFRDWDTRQELGQYDCRDAKQLLNWKPNSDRDRLVRDGIHAPMRRSLG